jgi:hypothetical protein
MRTPVSFTCALALIGFTAFGAEKKLFQVEGEFMAAGTCATPGNCSNGGVEKGCHVVGAMRITSGEYQGSDLAGVKIPYATAAGVWTRGSVQVAKESQRAAAELFARRSLAHFGRVEFVQPARAAISGRDGSCKVAVNNKRTPVVHPNPGDPLNRTPYQPETPSGSLSDAGQSFELKASASYFNDRHGEAGKI